MRKKKTKNKVSCGVYHKPKRIYHSPHDKLSCLGDSVKKRYYANDISHLNKKNSKKQMDSYVGLILKGNIRNCSVIQTFFSEKDILLQEFI